VLQEVGAAQGLLLQRRPDRFTATSQEADMASNGEEVDVRGEVVDLLINKIASDRNPSITMMNLVEQLLAPMTSRHMRRS
jgi:hypothetical protein